MWSYVEAKAFIKAESGFTYSARVRDNMGAYLQRADVSSIARSIIVVRTATAVSADQAAVAIDKNNAVFDTMQAPDARWGVDDVGFNFRDMIATVAGAKPFPEAVDYIVEYWVTPVAGRGDPFPLVIRVEASRRFAA